MKRFFLVPALILPAVPEHVLFGLKNRAKQHGVTMEEECGMLLAAAVEDRQEMDTRSSFVKLLLSPEDRVDEIPSMPRSLFNPRPTAFE